MRQFYVLSAGPALTFRLPLALLLAVSAVEFAFQVAWPSPVSVRGITIDRFGAAMGMLVSLIGLTCVRYADRQLDGHPEKGRFLRLALILSAPMVVASWINWQYFASTVNNRFFGSGDKTLHNRVGSVGVVEGNGGDLRPGLPMQSVHAPGGRWFHEPLRLHVIVEAPVGKIDRVISDLPAVRQLVANGWVRLSSLDPEGCGIQSFRPGFGWERA